MSGILAAKTKICTQCKKEKDLSCFYKQKNRKNLPKLSSSCKVCRRAYYRQRRKDNLERIKAYEKQNYYKHKDKHKKRNREYRQNNPVKYRQAILKYNYNITIEQWDDMYIEQGGRCAICGIHQSKLSKRLSVDHCHKTGIIRGLLCINCNKAIGFAYDNIDVLENAIKYLKRI